MCTHAVFLIAGEQRYYIYIHIPYYESESAPVCAIIYVARRQTHLGAFDPADIGTISRRRPN